MSAHTPEGPDSRGPHPDAVLPTSEAELAVIESLRHVGFRALPDSMGIQILEFGAERTVARMPVAGNTQAYGLLHGGASAVLAESVGSLAAALHAGPDRIALGLELNCTHHRAAREGFVVGTATPLALGRSVASYAISITDDAGALVCTARLTCLLRDR